jgi:hypothetical protein
VNTPSKREADLARREKMAEMGAADIDFNFDGTFV